MERPKRQIAELIIQSPQSVRGVVRQADVARLLAAPPMWFDENPLKIDRKINIPIERFEIILFLYFPEKLFCITKKINLCLLMIIKVMF